MLILPLKLIKIVHLFYEFKLKTQNLTCFTYLATLKHIIII